ncbi:MAG: Hsp20/alpha crystallin family protein [Candidatus Micrarchaeota archaeon]|nr:Hsp20/alpha crystallin family protein [Candidatus Micrarchaeota archaeon]
MAKKKRIEDPFSYLENFFTSDPNMINLFNVLVRELANKMERDGTPAEFVFREVTIKNGNEEMAHKVAQTPDKEIEIEPLVEVISNEKQIAVIAEVPGVKKVDIKLSYTPAALEISSGEGAEKKYFRQIALPQHLGSRNIKAKYTNGILEVILTKGKKINKDNDIRIE